MLLLVLFLGVVPLLAQQPGSVSGKVVNSVTGQPVKKAVVTLRTSDGQNPYITGSDQSGRFLFPSLPPATYIASAQAQGYSNAAAGNKPFAVGAGQAVEDLEVKVPPLAAISGKVFDDDGQPMAGVTVSASRYIYTSSGKSLMLSGISQTDDRGEYRLFDMPPGQYALVALARGAPQAERGPNVHSTVPGEAFAPLYYPGAADLSQAPPHDLTPGAEWTADFKLRRLPAYHIRGRVTGATSSRANSVLAWRCEREQIPMPLTSGALLAARLTDASFDISGVVSGTYCLNVQQAGAGMPQQTVTVKGSDIDAIELTVAGFFTVNGSVTIDGTPPTPMPQIGFGLVSSDRQGATHGPIESDGSFQIAGVYPGSYSFVMSQQGPQGPLYVKSLTYGGQDVTNGSIPAVLEGAALNITLGTDPGEIDGAVQPGSVDSGAPVLVAAFPEDAFAARQDMQRFSTSFAGGKFTLSNVPPGTYKVFSVQSEDFSDLYDRDLRKLLEAKATAVTVHAAGHEPVSVTAISSDELAQARSKLK